MIEFLLISAFVIFIISLTMFLLKKDVKYRGTFCFLLAVVFTNALWAILLMIFDWASGFKLF